MIPGLPFATFRLTILTLALLAQIYLFIRARQAIRSSRRSDRFKSRAVGVAGAAICLLFAANLYILFRPVPWADPPAAAQIGLFYPPAVWGLGSIFSALLLFLGQVAGLLLRLIVRLCHRLAGRRPFPSIRGAASCFRPGRAACLQCRCCSPDTAFPMPAGEAMSKSLHCLSAAPSRWFNSPTSMLASS